MGKERINPLPIVSNFTIKKTGIIDLNGLFAAIPEWFERYNYTFFQKGHSEKVSSTGRYIESVWKGERKVSYYVKYILQLEILARDINDVLVEDRGKKLKRTRGRIQLVFNSQLEKNYLKTFSETKGTFSYFIKLFYEKYIIRYWLKKHEEKLYFETQDFMETLKNFLQ